MVALDVCGYWRLFKLLTRLVCLGLGFGYCGLLFVDTGGLGLLFCCGWLGVVVGYLISLGCLVGAFIVGLYYVGLEVGDCCVSWCVGFAWWYVTWL